MIRERVFSYSAAIRKIISSYLGKATSGEDVKHTSGESVKSATGEAMSTTGEDVKSAKHEEVKDIDIERYVEIVERGPKAIAYPRAELLDLVEKDPEGYRRLCRKLEEMGFQRVGTYMWEKR